MNSRTLAVNIRALSLKMVTKAKADDMVRAAAAAERAHVAEQLEQFSELLGEEVAVLEKTLRADFTAELERLRAEIGNQRGGDAVVDLPDWRSHVSH